MKKQETKTFKDTQEFDNSKAMKNSSAFEKLNNQLSTEVGILESYTTELYGVLSKLGNPEVSDESEFEANSIPGDNSVLNELKIILDKIKMINENQRILVREFKNLV